MLRSKKWHADFCAIFPLRALFSLKARQEITKGFRPGPFGASLGRMAVWNWLVFQTWPDLIL
jgi:hypothetical protein